MNKFIADQHDKLADFVIVYGLAGLLFYASVLVAGFGMKFGLQTVNVLKGLGL